MSVTDCQKDLQAQEPAIARAGVRPERCYQAEHLHSHVQMALQMVFHRVLTAHHTENSDDCHLHVCQPM